MCLVPLAEPSPKLPVQVGWATLMVKRLAAGEELPQVEIQLGALRQRLRLLLPLLPVQLPILEQLQLEQQDCSLLLQEGG
jgi:hypothetical protein